MPAEFFIEPGQTHVENFHRAPFVDQQIPRLDVAVNDSFAVREFQPTGGLQNAIERRFHIQRPVLAEQRVQIATLHEFHHQVVDALLLAGIERGDDVRMTEPRRGLHLAAEAAHIVGSHHRPRRQHFERDDALHPLMLGFVNLPHAAGADAAENQILAQHFDFLRHRRRLHGCRGR